MSFLRPLWKVLRWILLGLVAILLLTYLFQSPLVKWAVREYSPEHTGRRITLEHFRYNPFTTSVRIKGLKVMEAEEDSVFLEVKEIYVNSSLIKALGGLYEVTALHIDHPSVRVTQQGDRFNFSDLIDRFAPTDTLPDTTHGEPVHFALYDIRVDTARLSYQSHLLPYPIRVERASVSCPQVKWDVALIEALLELKLLNGSTLNAEVDFDQERMRYALHVVADAAPCKMAEPYILPYFTIGGLEGLFNADLFMRGSANDPMAFSMKGKVGMSDFAMNDPNGVKLTGVKHLEMVIDTLDVEHDNYRVRRFVLDEPYVFAELYPEGDNFTKWIVASDSSDVSEVEEELGYDPENPFSMLAHYVEMIAENYTTMYYRLDSLGVLNGTVLFNDYTLQETFHYELTEMSLRADDINSQAKEIVLQAHSVLNGTGTFDAELGLDPTTLRNMRMNYVMEGVFMPDFGPYTVFYVAHPILSGRTRYECNTTITDNKLNSENHIHVEDFNFGKKMDITDAFNLPMRLAVSLMKDKDGNIVLDVPVEGDLDDPEYKVWPIIWQVLKNLVIKAVNAPVTLLSKAFGADEDDLTAVRFLNLQEQLGGQQQKPLNTLARVAMEKPELKIELVQTGDRRNEAEAYALRTAKAAYYADSTGIAIDSATKNMDDLLESVDILSSGFSTWVTAKVGAEDEPVQKKCMRLVGQENADRAVDRLYSARLAHVLEYLRVEKELPEGTILVRDRVETDTIPAAGLPTFLVLYGVDEE